MIRRLVGLIELASKACGAIAAILVVVLVVLMLYDVVLRYAFSAPTIWAYEVSTWAMGASFVLAIGYALATDSHVRVDLLYDWVNRRVLGWVDLVGLVVLLPIVAWLGWGLWHYFHEAYASGEVSGISAWNPKVWPFRLLVFLGFAAFTLQIVAQIIKTASRLAGHRLPSDVDRHAVTHTTDL
jgi:TRAP-type mannitol/chloroaromatic compound transport system permease small subunit